MTRMDLRVLCVALGFTAVVIRDAKIPTQEGVARAAEFARLIEEYSRITLPEAF